MKTKFVIITALLLSQIISIKAATEKKKMVQSKLSEATVFFQGAELTHSLTASLQKGDNELWIEGLSPIVDLNSIKIKTNNGVLVSSYEYSIDYLSKDKPNQVEAKKLQDSIDVYKKKLSEVTTHINVNKNFLELLQKGVEKNVSGSENGLAVAELMKTIESYRTQSLTIEQLLLDYQTKSREYTQTISRLENQLRQESTKNVKNSGILKLTLASPLTITSDLLISYYTPSASWAPYYDINVESTDKPIQIIGKAKVRQITGLDWDKVKLTLSTSTPSNGKVAPLFRAWFLQQMNFDLRQMSGGRTSKKSIDLSQNAYFYAQMEPQMSERSADVKEFKDISRNKNILPLYVVDGTPVDQDYYNSLAPEMIKSNEYMDTSEAINRFGSAASGGAYIVTLKSSMDDYVTLSDNSFDAVYNIDLPYTIPGNGKEQSITLLTTQADASYTYYCAPRLDKSTYLLANIANWEKLNLLSGKANITYDGTYVGETYIDANSTQSTLSLTLGTDNRVVVKREKLKDYSSTKFLGSDTKQVFTYKMTVKNNQNKSIKVILKDQYPISTDKSIEIELLTKDTTNPTAKNEEVGVLSWEENFEPGETKTYQISYSVKYPKNTVLNL